MFHAHEQGPLQRKWKHVKKKWTELAKLRRVHNTLPQGESGQCGMSSATDS